MKDNLIPEGRFLARVTEAVLARTSNGDPQVAAGFDIMTPESSAGRQITWYGSLSDTVMTKGKNEGRRVAELTFDTLDVMGWDGEDLGSSSLSTCVGNEVSLVIVHEEDLKGTMRARVKFVNSPNGVGAAVKDRIDDNGAANVTKKFQGLLMKRKQQQKARSGSTQAQKPRAQRPPAGAGDAWEPDADSYGFDDL